MRLIIQFNVPSGVKTVVMDAVAGDTLTIGDADLNPEGTNWVIKINTAPHTTLEQIDSDVRRAIRALLRLIRWPRTIGG